VRLIRFRVRDFRSVVDSDWIEVERVTALIGVNEPGKTNLLLPLWKLDPAREAEIRRAPLRHPNLDPSGPRRS
jgi:recombinational DNA repair ATPase RecF